MNTEEYWFSPLLHMWKHLLLHIWNAPAARHKKVKLLQISKLFMQNSSCSINCIQTSMSKRWPARTETNVWSRRVGVSPDLFMTLFLGVWRSLTGNKYMGIIFPMIYRGVWCLVELKAQLSHIIYPIFGWESEQHERKSCDKSDKTGMCYFLTLK